MRKIALWSWVFVCFLVVSCGMDDNSSSSSNQASTQNKTLYLIVTVDWEGHGLASDDLTAMRDLRQDYPEVPFVQYLNASYFTKPDANAYAVRQKINSVLLPEDEHGLHIHGWKSLFEQAGVEFRNSPNWNPNGQPLTDAECVYDCGHSIPITAYSYSELRQVIDYSIQVLTNQGYDKPRSFRAGGWMASDDLFKALAAEGLTSDSSAVETKFLSKLSKYRLYSWLVKLWDDISTTSQPYKVDQGLWEIPDNGALADYSTYSDMVSVINDNLKALSQSSDSNTRYVVIGFHQETMVKYGSRIRQILSAVRKYNQNATIPIAYRTLNIGN
jgi:hypothetical protein